MDISLELPSDILRLIILISKINDIKNIGLINKSFYLLCCERNLWLEKFKEKNLIIIDNDIKNIGQYMNEYRKVSYALYTANCLINMIRAKKYIINYNICSFSPYFIIDDFIKIFTKDNLIFNEIIKYKNIRKYLDITINMIEKVSVLYSLYKTVDGNEDQIISFTGNYDNIDIIIPLITKILYYYPLINIKDIDCLPIIISENTKNTKNNSYHVQNIITTRKKYWGECYSKYEELYF